MWSKGGNRIRRAGHRPKCSAIFTNGSIAYAMKLLVNKLLRQPVMHAELETPVGRYPAHF